MKDYSELVRRLRERGQEVIWPPISEDRLLMQSADAIEALQRDAARYRWLRGAGPDKGGPFIAQRHPQSIVSAWTGQEADTAIDAAMKDAP